MLMFEKLNQVESRYEDLNRLMANPQVYSSPDEYRRITKERAEIEELVNTWREYKRLREEIESNRALSRGDDPELASLAREELTDLEKRFSGSEEKLHILLLPKDPLDEKNVLLEIRAGTGGNEAGLFAAELFRMYARYAERRRWKLEILSSNETGLGGYKEIIALIAGAGAYSRLKFERGVHRVQRVPVTESSGRIHTSTVTVAVLPEADDVDVKIDENDIRVDVFRSSGPGGQSVNTTDSAVRITHLPSGIVISCQDEKSQHKNKAKGLKILRARLLELARQEQEDEISSERRSQVGTGERSEKIRTYNFPQNRVTDHRIGYTHHQLSNFLDGDLDDTIDRLITHYQTETLKKV
jgi:peptide chain release factor 1